MTSLVNKYASLIGDVDIEDHEAKNIADFVSDVVDAKLASDSEGVARSVYCFLSTLPPEAQTKVAKILEEIDNTGDPLEKSAGIFDSMKTMGPVGRGILGGVVGVGVPAAVGGIMAVAGKALDKMIADKGGRVLGSVLKSAPHLRENMDQTLANYATIQKFSPTLAGDANSVGGLLNNLGQMGPGALTYQTLSQLAKMEADVQRTKKDSGGYFSAAAEGVNRGIQGASGNLAQNLFKG